MLRDVFGWHNVDAGDGWLIFALPPAELGVHPVMDGDKPHRELSFMCDDLAATIDDLRERGIEVRGEPEDRGFGVAVVLALPGVDVMVYEPHHPTAI